MRQWSRTKLLHGQSKASGRTRVYRIWTGMRNRCNNKRNRSYHKYGGRGIKVCERWDSFENFYADMGEPPTAQHQIERKRNDGNYEPDNCRWATPKEQANNRRSSRVIEYKGKTQTLAAWCRELGLKPSTVSMRLNHYGWTVERVFGEAARDWYPGKPQS